MGSEMQRPRTCRQNREQKRNHSQNSRIIRKEVAVGKEAHELEMFRIGEEVRRSRMPALTLKYLTGTCDAEGAWGPAGTLVCY